MTKDEQNEEREEHKDAASPGAETHQRAEGTEEALLKVSAYVHKIIARKLGASYAASVEDVKQRALLKLWRWDGQQQQQQQQQHDNQAQKKRTPSDDEWRKMANVVASREAAEFFREKYTSRDIVFSQLNEETQKTVFAIPSGEMLEGNARHEICSQLKLVWRAAQAISSVRQKYAYFLAFPDFIVEFIACGCCSIEELAEYFETDEKGLFRIIGELPFEEAEIAALLATNFGERSVKPKQLWEARAKAKRRLARKLGEYVADGRLSDERGS